MHHQFKIALAIYCCYVQFHSLIVSALSSATTKSNTWGGWRVALNIGREKFSTMPNSWASSGARFPLIIQCNFTNDGNVYPISGEVRYTLAEGEVVKPVQTGSWSLTNNNRDLSFSFIFPEEMERNDVKFGPCELICEGLLYTQTDLEALDKDFYRARSAMDEVNADVKEMKRRREAPKKWNFETEKWEKRYSDESIVSNVSKRLKQLASGVVEEAQSKKRPSPIELSLESGEFPGIDCNVYLKKGGSVKTKGAGIIGIWGAEPINDNPASYYRPSY